MTTQRFGHIVVTGGPADLAFAAKVYGSVLPGKPFPGDLEPKDFPIEFHTRAEFLARGLVIPGTEGKRPKTPANPKGGIAAYGYTLNNVLWARSDLRPKDQAYPLEHEPFHPIVAAHMTKSKRAQLLPLVEKVANGTAYQNRLSEVLCDAFVELFYGHSTLDEYYGDIANVDLQKAWDILMETTSEKPAPVDPPAPLPLDDKDAQIADLQGQVQQLLAALQTCQKDRDDALARIAKKDAAMKEGLAA